MMVGKRIVQEDGKLKKFIELKEEDEYDIWYKYGANISQEREAGWMWEKCGGNVRR